MNQFHISFDMVSLILVLILLIVYRGKNRSSMNVYRACFWIMGAIAVSAVSHIALHMVVMQKMDVMTANILAVVVSLGYVAMSILYTAFILYLVGVDIIADYKFCAITCIPSFFVAALFVASPWCGFILRYDEEFNYIPGNFEWIVAALEIFFVCFWLVILFMFRKNIDRKTKAHIVHLIGMLILLGVLSWFSDYSVMAFGSVLALMSIMYSLKRPEEVFDSSNAMYKRYLYKNVALDFARGKQFATIFLTLHDLDIMNDTFGQDEVSNALHAVNNFILSQKLGINVYRVDSVTFAIVFHYKKVARVDQIRENIMDRFLDEWRVGDVYVRIPVSMATLYAPQDVSSIEDYRSMVKFFARNKLAIGQNVEAAVYRKDDKEPDIIAAVKKATEEKSFQVYYQPIYSTDKKCIIAAEALIRLFDEKLGFISPEIFIPLAEREGYILEIGRFVFEQVCEFYSSNDLSNRGIQYIEVNLSAIQCMQYQLAEEFSQIMKDYGIRPSQINFEITETSAMASNAAVSMNINSFVDKGIDLSLDDYGTGYSNLSYLYHLPFSIIKIDKSILWSADKNDKANITLANIFQMAKNLKMHIVVEGVETEEQIKKLLAFGCDYFQGYYFSKPIPGKDFVSYINNFELPEVCR